MQQSKRVLMLLASAAFFAAAQSDPPGRVGRLSYMNGEVSYRPGDVDEWVGADFNRPLTTGDHLWTDEGARAELRIGSAALRLNSRTAFEFLNLDDANVQIRLAQGSLSVHVRRLEDQDTFEVDTPNLAFSLLRPGEYRIDVNPDDQTTTITVHGGEGEATGGGQAFTVHPREQAQVSGGDSLSYNVIGVPPPDEFDNWCVGRNRREDQSQSARYVSRDVVGYQDLDDYGSWRDTPEYGAVWAPSTVAAGWAPYHDGRWVWVEPWGWTWVDDAPWGFAPFHYGRWVYVGYWAWVPGPIAVRPVYAPALVAWVGGGNFGVGVSFGGGAGVGWFPLGPREVYVPSYRASPTYINRVNVTNTTIVNNINVTNVYNNTTYINRGAPGAVTAVPQNSFGGARSVQSSAVRIDPRAIQTARVISGAPVAPTRQSVLGNSAPPPGRVKQPPAAVQNRPVVAKAAPPPPAVPFAQRQQALSANPGRSLDTTEVQRLRSTQPAPMHPFVRQAQVPTNPNRPGGQVASPPTQNSAPPPRVQRDVPPPTQNDAPPPRVQRDVPPPTQNDAPPPRVQRDVPPPTQNSAPPPRIQRDVPPPTQNSAPPPRIQRDVPPPTQNSAPPPRVQRDVPPPAQNSAPPPRVIERPAQPPPQPRVAEPPTRQERPAQREAPKEEKKAKKDEKKEEKKQ